MAKSIHENHQCKKLYNLSKLYIPLFTSLYFEKVYPNVCLYLSCCNLNLIPIFLTSGKRTHYPLLFCWRICEGYMNTVILGPFTLLFSRRKWCYLVMLLLLSYSIIENLFHDYTKLTADSAVSQWFVYLINIISWSMLSLLYSPHLLYCFFPLLFFFLLTFQLYEEQLL